MSRRRVRIPLPENPAVRWIGGAVLFVVALNLLVTAIGSYAEGPSGPVSSSYATSPKGVAAWAELLERAGHPVEQLRLRPAAASLDRNATVVILDPDFVSPDDEFALESFVDGGGRLIAGATEPAPWLGAVLDDDPVWSQGGPTQMGPVAAAPLDELDGVTAVAAAGEGHWSDPVGTPALGGDGEIGVWVAHRGPGHVVALADPSPLQNRLLGEADNAKLALEIAGEPDATVVFVESVHGFEETGGGFGVLPYRWRVAAAGLLLAAVVWMIARGRRLGPPELAARPLQPPRKTYVDSLGVALRRTKRPGEATAPVRAAARSQLVRRSGLSGDATDEEIMTAGRRQGLPEGELRAIVHPPTDDAGVLAAGRVLARLMGGRK
jgi:hypothetical protein